jgi:hypothetical protein
MMNNNGCNHTPEGHEVKALYFTKAPGDKYLSVYAQYNGDPAWVPLHLTVPATPDLQQVRDRNRNIAIDSGSYEDAHLYLRSADGNNMTAAYFTNAAGGGIQVGNADNYAPLNLQPGGGTLTYGGAEVATQEWVRQHALAYKPDTVTDFNAITQSGIYTINGNLTSISNYPHIGNNNNSATSGYLVVYQSGGNSLQFFYPTYEAGTMNRGAGYWYRRTIADIWEYKDGILEINMRFNPVLANNLTVDGTYIISGNLAEINAGGYPDSGAAVGGIPLMVTVRKRWGNVSFNYTITQEAISMQESGSNFTRKWIRSLFNWNGAKVWDAWNEVGLLRDVYTKAQLNASGAGGNVHWDNVTNKPAIVNVETDPTVPAHVKTIGTSDISNWNGKENTANKSTNAALGTSNTLFPTQNAVKTYVDGAIATNNASYIPLTQKGAANGVATLGSNGKIPDAQMPAIAITNTSSVSSQAQMLALAAEVGDVAVRTDINKSFILQNAPASTLANWIELRSPTITNSDQVPEGSANLYFTNARSRAALGAAAPITYNSTTGAIGITQAATSANGYLSAADWNTFNGKEPAFAKNTAFNKNFGTAAGTVAEGNDSRINNGQTAFTWGNHAAAGYLSAIPGIGSVLNTYNYLAQDYRSSIMFNGGYDEPIGGNANMILFKVENGFSSGKTNGGIYWTKVHGGGGDIGNWNTSSYNSGAETSSIEGVTDSSSDTGIGMGLQFKVQDYYWHGIGKNNAFVAMKIRARGSIEIPAYGDGSTTRVLTAGPTGVMGVAAATDWLQSNPAAAQSANPWITGTYKGEGIAGADGSKLLSATGYWQLLNMSNGAHPLKTGGLTISDTYADSMPANGLSVKGDAWLRGNKTIVGRGIADNEEIAMVLGYTDFSGNYEKVKFISRRLDSAARQNLYICVNNGWSSSSATTADCRVFVDGTTGNVGIGTTDATEKLTVGGHTGVNGTLRVSSLSSTGVNMVVADAWGNLSIQALPGAGSWFAYNNYPAPYVTPSNTPSGTQGIDTAGGFSAKGIITSAGSYVVQDDDYTVLFNGDCTVDLPDPADWPGRILRLRAGPYTAYFNNYNVVNYGTTLSSFSKGLEIQSINGAWHLISASVA